MENSNLVEVLWKVDGVRADAPEPACLSKCIFFLYSLGRTEWIQYLAIDHNGLELALQRSPSDGGPELIELEWDVHLLSSDDSKWGEGPKKVKIFRMGDSGEWITLATRQELMVDSSGLLDQGSVRVCTRLNPAGCFSRPLTLLARACAGLTRRITFTVEQFSDLLWKGERGYLLENLSDARDTWIVVFLEKGKVCVQVRSELKYGPVLVESVHLMKADGQDLLCWKGERFLRTFIPSDYIGFIDINVLRAEPNVLLHKNELTMSFQLIDYIHYSPCLASEIAEGKISPTSLFNTSVCTSDRATNTTPPPSGAEFCDAISTKSQGNNTEDSIENGHPNCPLVSDFESLLDDETISDFKLKVGPECISVHRAVLYARSPVFKAMLESPMLESCKNEVEVPDFRPDTIRRLVRYLYTGSAPDLNTSAAVDLYSAADKYEVFALRDQCSRVIVAGLGTKNVCHMLLLSETHQDTYLKEKVVDFIGTHEQQVFLSQEWLAFMKKEPQLALEVSHDLHVKKYDGIWKPLRA